MFRSIAILASLVGASAFAPLSAVRATSALMAKGKTVAKAAASFEDALGAQAPLGFWDPLDLLKDADEARFARLRYVENKHGRISMLAIVGHLFTAAGVRLGGDIAPGIHYADMKAGLAALDTIPAGGSTQILLFIGALELGFGLRENDIKEACVKYQENFPPSAFVPFDLERTSAIELNNGRAAQMGILALMIHEKLDNNPYIINSLLGAPVPFNV
jgi:Chlorophyll A-B binding protein